MNELLSLNVNDRVEKKGNLSYLSWAWAWAEVLKFDPAATWAVVEYGPENNRQPCCWIGDTAMVHTTVTIKGVERSCMLPVMDNKNNAVKNPDARKISDAIMRCMTKTAALHGLGLYIYAGEDLPQVEDEETTADKARLRELEELATYMVDCHHAGEDMKAIDLWYAEGTFRDNEERLYVWGFLKPESKLRSAIKSNNPSANKEKEAA
jgi:hypothetical protein